jgi:putative ABC transport system permease protein
VSRGRRAGTGRTPFALRPALRLGRRLAFAKAGRAALIIALIGIPTAGFAAVAVVVQSTQATASEQLDYDLGRASAQMRVSGPDMPGMVQDPVQWEYTDSKRNSPVTKSDEDSPFTNVLAHVPDGALSIPVGSTPVVVQGAHGPVGLTAVEGSVWDPSLEGHWHVLDGSRPATRSELMVTPATLERLGAQIGDTVDLTDPVTKRFTITGTMTDLGADPGSQGIFLPWARRSRRPTPPTTSD